MAYASSIYIKPDSTDRNFDILFNSFHMSINIHLSI
jgi:hypothetical protein